MSWREDVALELRKDIPTVPDLLLQWPLYKQLVLDQEADDGFINLVHRYNHTIDAHCLGCGSSSVFHRIPGLDDKDFEEMMIRTPLRIVRGASPLWLKANLQRDFHVTFACSRDFSHHLCFWFALRENALCKSGQFPSLADLANVHLNAYASVLSPDNLRELKRGVGLAAHGVGIGSVVYLRRILESLLEAAHKTAVAEDHSWDEEAFQKERVKERIVRLKEHLPEFMVNNAVLYGLLSKGIHEFNEVECLDAFPVLWTGIEMILDEKLYEAQRQKKIKAASQSLSQLPSKNSNGG